jgi:hypothetical protein
VEGKFARTFANPRQPLEVVPIFQLTVWTFIAFKKEGTSTLVCVIDKSLPSQAMMNHWDLSL